MNILAVALIKICGNSLTRRHRQNEIQDEPLTYFHGVPFVASIFRVEKFVWFYILLISFGFTVRQIYLNIDTFVSEGTSSAISYGNDSHLDRPVLCFELYDNISLWTALVNSNVSE